MFSIVTYHLVLLFSCLLAPVFHYLFLFSQYLVSGLPWPPPAVNLKIQLFWAQLQLLALSFFVLTSCDQCFTFDYKKNIFNFFSTKGGSFPSHFASGNIWQKQKCLIYFENHIRDVDCGGCLFPIYWPKSTHVNNHFIILNTNYLFRMYKVK